MQNKPNLPESEINASSVSTKDYVYFMLYNSPKNKPNSNPIKPNTKPISKKPKMNVNIYYTTVYNNKTAFRRMKNKPNQTQFKPNFSVRLIYGPE